MIASRIPFPLLVCGIAAWLGGCEASVPPPPPPPDVTVATPVQRDVSIYKEFTGNVDAMEAVDVRARVKGFLESKHFEDGSVVEKDQQLFVIEPEPYEREVDRLAAEAAAKKVELEQAEFDLDKTEELARESAATAKQLNDAQIDVARAKAALAAADASLHQAELNLEYTKVTSPIRGRISRNYVDVGNLVGAGESTLLTTVVLMAPVHVYFEVDERTIVSALGDVPVEDRFRPQEGARPFHVALPGEAGFAHEGSIDFMDNTVDAETGTIRVRGVIPNTSRLFIPGQFVRVRVPVAFREDAVLVQEAAIGADLGGKFLLIVNDQGIVEHRPVVLGQQEEDLRLIREGLEPGERYIVTGLQRARPGLPVNVTEQSTPTPETDPANTDGEG